MEEGVFKTRKIDGNIIRRTAKKLKCKITDLLALTTMVDPFWAGATPSLKRAAEWAARLWREMGKPEIHGRGFNYSLMGHARLPHDGRLYDGSDKDYAFSRRALEQARYQGLIPYEKIPDHKTRFHQNFEFLEHNDIHELVNFNVNYEWIQENVLYHFWKIWYPYQLQDTVCEAWIEKSSVVKSLKGVMTSYKANYIEGEGDISLLRCWEFVQRIIKYYNTFGIKKYRVFYISDFDPVGLSMPISMARKVEYLIYKELDKLNMPIDEIDIRVEDIAVTPEQVKNFALKPTKVPKEKVTRKDGKKSSYATRVKRFRKIYGIAGVVELEALTQTDPEELPRVLRERLSRYYDKEVDRWINFEMDRIRTIIKTILDNVDWNDLPKLGSLRIDWSPLEEYVEIVTPPEARHNESSDWGVFWLLESKLDYAQQLLRYKQFKFNKKDEYMKTRYPEGRKPEPAKRIEGKSVTEEKFQEFLVYTIRKQKELREIPKEDP